MSAIERLRALAGRLGMRLSRRRVVDDVTEELESHLELLIERYISEGLEPDQAAVAARRQLGNTTRVREDVYTMNGVAWLERGAAERFNPGVLLRPGLDPLRGDARFADLLRRVGLPAAH